MLKNAETKSNKNKKLLEWTDPTFIRWQSCMCVYSMMISYSRLHRCLRCTLIGPTNIKGLPRYSFLVLHVVRVVGNLAEGLYMYMYKMWSCRRSIWLYDSGYSLRIHGIHVVYSTSYVVAFLFVGCRLGRPHAIPITRSINYIDKYS